MGLAKSSQRMGSDLGTWNLMFIEMGECLYTLDVPKIYPSIVTLTEIMFFLCETLQGLTYIRTHLFRLYTTFE